MREYIESLENGEAKTERQWREIITNEIQDILSQSPDAAIVDVDEAIKQLDADGYITE